MDVHVACIEYIIYEYFGKTERKTPLGGWRNRSEGNIKIVFKQRGFEGCGLHSSCQDDDLGVSSCVCGVEQSGVLKG
jgi:hypothetical protein